MQEFTFRLCAPLTLPNRVSLGANWRTAAARKKADRVALAWEVLAAIGSKPGEPLKHAVIHVWRHGIQPPDHDNLTASLKGLLDVLQPASKRHPYGVGLIAGDDPARLRVVINHVPARLRSDQCTQVLIRETDAHFMRHGDVL